MKKRTAGKKVGKARAKRQRPNVGPPRKPGTFTLSQRRVGPPTSGSRSQSNRERNCWSEYGYLAVKH
jgi:hypothetical protein